VDKDGNKTVVNSSVDKDGNLTTTKDEINNDGSKESTITKADGSVTSTTTDKDGRKTVTTLDRNGHQTSEGPKGKYTVDPQPDGSKLVHWDLPSGTGGSRSFPAGTDIRPNSSESNPLPFDAKQPPPKP
jgi:hypothetical protein